MKRPPKSTVESPDLNGLLPLMQQLDRRLAQVSTVAPAENTPKATSIERLSAQNWEALETELLPSLREDSPVAWLQQTFSLSDFDLKIVAIALAPELDRHYERLYAYLQDDVRCKRPTVALALNLLCTSPAEKLARRAHFGTDTPLMRQRLLHLVSDFDWDKPTLLARNLQLDDQLVRLLLGQLGLDERLTPYCQLVQPAISLSELSLKAEVKQGLSRLTLQYWQTHQPLRLYFQGSDRTGKRRAAEALAGAAKVSLLVVDLARLVDAKIDFEPTLKLIEREAWFQNTWVYFDNLDALLGESQGILYQYLLAALAEHQGIAILTGVQPWIPSTTEPLGIVVIPFPLPDFDQRRECWRTHLTAAGITVNGLDLDGLSDRFRLTPEQIADAVAIVCNTARWEAACVSEEEELSKASLLPNPTSNDLFAAARFQSGHGLVALARKIEPKVDWDDLVLPSNQKTQLRELCNEVKYRHLIWDAWGFESKLSLGKGLTVLFSGSPGTGKTMAAEAIACELQLDLYKIDLSQVVSKYIGETQKNLNRIFMAAENSNAILLFDEADALFGKRSEVRDARDRYANIETSYLLQKMEEYEGVAILTTNLRNNMDEAFVRRLRFIIEFPLPSFQERRRIWEQIWPDCTPRSPDLDLDFLARRFEVPGANIRNIALRAAFLSADDGGVVTMEHLIGALRREYQKMGKILMETELNE